MRRSLISILFILFSFTLLSGNTLADCKVNFLSYDEVHPAHQYKIYEKLSELQANVCPSLLNLFGKESFEFDIKLNSNLESHAIAYRQKRLIEIIPNSLISSDASELLAHELFHLFHFEQFPKTPGWLSEGLAQYYSFLLTNELNSTAISKALETPRVNFFRAYQFDGSEHQLYGHHFLYFKFIIDQCGGEILFRDLLKITDIYPIEVEISNVLALQASSKPHCQDFKSSFVGYQLARLINKRIYSSLYPQEDQFDLIFFKSPVTMATKREISQFKENAYPLDTLILKADDSHLLDSENIHRIWIEKNSPYKISPSKPEGDLSHWILMGIKH